MPSPVLLPFLKEILPDKNIMFSYFDRHRLTTLLLISHIVFFFLLLFMSEQNIQKETALIESKRTGAASAGAMVQLTTCQMDLVVAKREAAAADESADYAQSDYRQVNGALSDCKVALEQKSAVPSPVPRPTTPRVIPHPPRRLETDNVNYQQMLEGV